MIMSRRLKHIAAQVMPCNVLADIGCDHGHLPVYLVQNGSIKKAVATDISKGSCIKAQNNITLAGLEDKIDVRCGDGLEPVAVEDNAECIVISGMGGKLMIHILESNFGVTENSRQLVLQPQKDIYAVRKYIHNIGFKIIDEDCLEEEGKFYNIINAVKGYEEPYSENEYILGRYNIEKRQEAFIKYITIELDKMQKIIKKLKTESSDNTRIKEIERLCTVYEGQIGRLLI